MKSRKLVISIPKISPISANFKSGLRMEKMAILNPGTSSKSEGQGSKWLIWLYSVRGTPAISKCTL
jgi:hypothetical protein